MSNWTPDPEFVEYLTELEKFAGNAMPEGLAEIIEEICSGSERGKLYYDLAMADPKVRKDFENWKKRQ